MDVLYNFCVSGSRRELNDNHLRCVLPEREIETVPSQRNAVRFRFSWHGNFEPVPILDRITHRTIKTQTIRNNLSKIIRVRPNEKRVLARA